MKFNEKDEKLKMSGRNQSSVMRVVKYEPETSKGTHAYREARKEVNSPTNPTYN